MCVCVCGGQGFFCRPNFPGGGGAAVLAATRKWRGKRGGRSSVGGDRARARDERSVRAIGPFGRRRRRIRSWACPGRPAPRPRARRRLDSSRPGRPSGTRAPANLGQRRCPIYIYIYYILSPSGPAKRARMQINNRLTVMR